MTEIKGNQHNPPRFTVYINDDDDLVDNLTVVSEVFGTQSKEGGIGRPTSWSFNANDTFKVCAALAASVARAVRASGGAVGSIVVSLAPTATDEQKTA